MMGNMGKILKDSRSWLLRQGSIVASFQFLEFNVQLLHNCTLVARHAQFHRREVHRVGRLGSFLGRRTFTLERTAFRDCIEKAQRGQWSRSACQARLPMTLADGFATKWPEKNAVRPINQRYGIPKVYALYLKVITMAK